MSIVRSIVQPIVRPVALPMVGGRGGGAPQDIDLFIIVGQSNAEGRGDSSLSPAAPNGRYISGSTITSPLADPVGGALTGSMWPAFSNEWYAQTARRSAFVEVATGGTPLLPDTSGTNWSPSGTLRAAAVSAANTAIAAINSSETYTLGNVYFIWSQGESDAQAINGTTITGPLYEQALEDLAAYFKAQVPSMVTMGVVRTGNRTPRTNEDDWAAIRAAQDDACTDSANLRMLYRGTASFPTDAQALMIDGVHYNQDGLNLAGKCAARELSKGSETAVPAAPAYLAHTAATDTDSAATASKTVAHTTHADTKLLVVAVAIARITTNTTTDAGTCTFNGVTMNRVTKVAAGNGGNPGRSEVAFYYLNESDYGATLGGVTANIVITPSATQNLIQLAAFDLDAEGLPDSAPSGALTSGVTGTEIDVSLTTGAPGFVVAACSSCADSASALTHSITGVTEVLDAGASNGTRAGQAGIGYRTATEGVGVDVGVAFSGTATSAAYMVAAFRAKIDGE